MRAARRPHLTVSRALVVCAAAMPGAAHAHAMFGSAAPFWSGVLHVLVTPLALAAVAALVLALAEASEGAIMRAVTGAALAAFGAAELASNTAAADSGTGIIATACVAVIALVALLLRRPSPWLATALGIGSGVAAGMAVGADVPDWGGSLGVGIALLVLASWGGAGLAHLQRRFAEPVLRARRLSAAAIVLLVLALAAAGHGS